MGKTTRSPTTKEQGEATHRSFADFMFDPREMIRHQVFLLKENHPSAVLAPECHDTVEPGVDT
jgi:hypothetical protein